MDGITEGRKDGTTEGHSESSIAPLFQSGAINMKALAQILFEISCTQDFQILFSKGHDSEKGHNLDMKKNMGQLFFHEESVYEI